MLDFWGGYLLEIFCSKPCSVDLLQCWPSQSSQPSVICRALALMPKSPVLQLWEFFLPRYIFLFCSLKKVEWMVRTFQKILMKNPHPKHRMDINPFQPCSDLYTQTLKGFQTVGETQFTWGSRTHLKWCDQIQVDIFGKKHILRWTYNNILLQINQ